ncbi:NAD-dependent epimerase/dehydratase family protein [Photobacterium phosphoreum]|uniref:NAD-dependent epimerase/dehydratase family protein n=1 Tax=Photobacterium phosphoreum TaxID=659 RepID=UPI0024B73A85|nr:NAD(P)-dependent oxidoreductase [Photobacterium phosphoreum]
MNVLVTGASGNLGRHIIKKLRDSDISVIPYSHKESLEVIDWGNIDCVINCAAIIPSSELNMSDYLQGNVLFLQRLVALSRGKHFIHFSTFSELYRNDEYQKSKMLANSLLLINSDLFDQLDILSLPTLDDEKLISSIVEAALNGHKPVVDKLSYNYMSFHDVANHVTSGLIAGEIRPISEVYKEKNLYKEVCKRVLPNLIIEGISIDRCLNSDGIYHVCPKLLLSFLN